MLYDKVLSIDSKTRVQRARQLLRATIELGTDAVKIPLYEVDELNSILENTHEDVLIFVAGGELCDGDHLLTRLSGAIENGAAGVCIGRNVFAQKRPQIFLEKLADVVHGGVTLSTTRGDLLHAY